MLIGHMTGPVYAYSNLREKIMKIKIQKQNNITNKINITRNMKNYIDYCAWLVLAHMTSINI